MQESRLILASGSPRRHQLLEMLGLAHLVRPTAVDETVRAGEDGAAYALRVAVAKALAAAGQAPELPVLGADTAVEVTGTILGKPGDSRQAAAMLRQLSGRSHAVHTAIALVIGGRCEALVDTAEVTFAELDEVKVQWYVATGEPLDKAGAYAIQGIGGVFVTAVNGSPHTVVGLPIHRLEELYRRHRRSLWDDLAR
jgi:septum formation protein